MVLEGSVSQEIHFSTSSYLSFIFLNMLLHQLDLPVFQFYVAIEAIIQIYQYFSALLLNEDSSFAQAKKPPCELINISVLSTAATRAHIWPVNYI